jgi:hypothetical protein
MAAINRLVLLTLHAKPFIPLRQSDTSEDLFPYLIEYYAMKKHGGVEV